MQKTEYKKTELLGIIKTGMKELEDKCEDIDIGYFNESDIDSYYNYLLSKYKDEIIVVDDTGEGWRRFRIRTPFGEKFLMEQLNRV